MDAIAMRAAAAALLLLPVIAACSSSDVAPADAAIEAGADASDLDASAGDAADEDAALPLLDGGSGACDFGGDAAPAAPTAALPTACGATSAQGCNPLDGAGCDVAGGETCDLGSDGRFACFAGPSAALEGAACDGRTGPTCAAGLTCVGAGDAKGTCARFCCDVGACGADQSCAPLATTGGAGSLGACVAAGGDAGVAGDGGATAPSQVEIAIGNHRGVVQGRSRVAPWTTWDDALAREVHWFATACPPYGGYPVFASATHMGGDCVVGGTEVIVAMQHGMGILSYLKYYAYTGRTDASLVETARALGDYMVKEALTPDEGVYPNFPRSTGHTGAIPQPADCGIRNDKPYEIEPDKGGIAGYALWKLHEETGERSYADVALSTARALAANMIDGDDKRSPWPFRADYRTGVGRIDVSGNVVYVLRLFDALVAAGHSELDLPRAKLWTWIKRYQIPNAKGDGQLFAQFFEDQGLPGNRTAWAPLNLARYLLEGQCAVDTEWREDVQTLLDFVQANFVDVWQGFPLCIEQDIDRKPFGGILSTYGGVLAMHAAATGSPVSRQRAHMALNLLVDSIDTDGCPGDKAISGGRGGWLEDAHFDKLHNFMDALAAFPQWAR